MKRVIALLLALCMVAVVLVACKKPEEKPNGSSSSTTSSSKATNKYGEEELEVMDWSTVDCEGENITVLCRDNDNYAREFGLEADAEVLDELDQKISARNDIVRGDLNLNVNVVREAGALGYNEMRDKFIDLVLTDVQNELHTYDIVAHCAYVAPNTAIRDCAANLLDEDTFPYFDFSLACWNQSIVKNTAINNKLYYIAGNMNISTFNAAMIMWHNKTLYDSVKEEIPKAPKNDKGEYLDLQDVAVAGEWTYSLLYNIASYYSDADHEGPCGDVYGVLLEGGKNGTPNPIDVIPYAWDVDIMTTNNDGTHAYNIIGNTKLQDAVTKYNNLFVLDGNAYTAYRDGGCTHNMYKHFTESKLLFSADIIYHSREMNLAIRAMTDKFALLPHPKYENTQDHYGVTTQDSYTLMTVLDHSKSPVPTKGETVSAYLQYSTEKSYENVYLFYLEEIVKPTWFGVAQAGQDDSHIKKSIAILNVLLQELSFEYWTIYSPLLNDAVWLFRDRCAHNESIETYYRENRDQFDDAVYETDKWLGLTN